MDSPETRNQLTNTSTENNHKNDCSSEQQQSEIPVICGTTNDSVIATDASKSEVADSKSADGVNCGGSPEVLETRTSFRSDNGDEVTGSNDVEARDGPAVEENACDILVSDETVKQNNLEISQPNCSEDTESKEPPKTPTPPPSVETSNTATLTQPPTPSLICKTITNETEEEVTVNSELVESKTTNVENGEQTTLESTTTPDEALPASKNNAENMEISSSSSSSAIPLPSTSRCRTTSSSSASNKEPTSVLDIIGDDSMAPRRHPSEIDDNSLLDKVILYSLKNNLFSNKSLESRVKDASLSNCFNTNTALHASPTKLFSMTTNSSNEPLDKVPITSATTENKPADFKGGGGSTSPDTMKSNSSQSSQQQNVIVEACDETDKMISSSSNMGSGHQLSICRSNSSESRTIENQVQQLEKHNVKHKNQTIATTTIIEQYSNTGSSGYRKTNENTTSSELDKSHNCDESANSLVLNANSFHNNCNDLPSTSISSSNENIDVNNQSKVVSASDRTSTPDDNWQMERQLADSKNEIMCSIITNEQPSASLDLSAPNRGPVDDTAAPPRRNSALYVRNPDFSRQIFTAPGIPSASSTTKTDLSQLHMKTPDFSKLAARPLYTTELQIQNPDFSNKFPPPTTDNRPSSSVILIDANNFAEIRQRNNYISDLQLKNPGPIITNAPTIGINAAYSSTTIQKAPDKIENKNAVEFPKEKIVLEEPTAHVIHKNQFLVQKEHLQQQQQQPQQQPLSNSPWDHRSNAIAPAPHSTSSMSTIEGKMHLDTSAYPSSSHYTTPTKQVNHQNMAMSSSIEVMSKGSRICTDGDMKTPSKPADPTKYIYEDQRRTNPSYYQNYPTRPPERPRENVPGSYNEPPKDARNPFEYGPESGFSLKYKEQQLRQEGTIITIKPEPVPSTNNTHTHVSKAVIDPAKSSVANIYPQSERQSSLARSAPRRSSADPPTIDLTRGQMLDPNSYQRNEPCPMIEIGKSYPGYSEDANRHPYKHPTMPVIIQGRPNPELVPHQSQTIMEPTPRGVVKSHMSGQMHPPQNWPLNQPRVVSSPHGSATSSPQNPAFLQSSPKPSPSPTHFNRMANPSPTPSRNVVISSPNQLSHKSTPSPSSYLSTSPHQPKYVTNTEPCSTQFDASKHAKRSFDHSIDQQRYTEQKFNDQKFVEQKYAEQKYAEQKYAEQKYAEQKYAEQKYAEQKYAEQKYAEQKYAEQKYAEQKYAEQKYAEQKYAEQKYAEQKYAEQKYAEQMQYYNNNRQHNSNQTPSVIPSTSKYPMVEKYVVHPGSQSSNTGHFVEMKRVQKIPDSDRYPQKYHSQEDISVHNSSIKYASSHENLLRSSTIVDPSAIHIQPSHRRIPADMYPVKSSSSESQMNHSGLPTGSYVNSEIRKSDSDMKRMYSEQDARFRMGEEHAKFTSKAAEVHQKRDPPIQAEKMYKYPEGTLYPSTQPKYNDSRYARSTSVIASGSGSVQAAEGPNSRRNFDNYSTEAGKYSNHLPIQKIVPNQSERLRLPDMVPPTQAKATIYYPETVAVIPQQLPNTKESQQLPPQLPANSQATFNPKPEPRPQEEIRIKKASTSVAASKVVSSTLNGPTKRESPLDLSVKTVKTKADSTGCDDSSLIHSTQRVRNYSPQAPKIEFAPNFSKRIQPGAAPQTYTYDPRLPAAIGSAQLSTVKDVRPVIMGQNQPPHLQGGSTSSTLINHQPHGSRGQVPAHPPSSSSSYGKRGQVYPVGLPNSGRPEEAKMIIDPTRYDPNVPQRKEEYDIRSQYRVEHNQPTTVKSMRQPNNPSHNFPNQPIPNNNSHLAQHHPQQASRSADLSNQAPYPKHDKIGSYPPHQGTIVPLTSTKYYPNNYNASKPFTPIEAKDKNQIISASKDKIQYQPQKTVEDQQRLEDRKYVESILYNKKGTLYPSDLMMRSQYEKSIPPSGSSAKQSLIMPPRKRPPPDASQLEDLHAKQPRIETNRENYGGSHSEKPHQLPNKDYPIHADYYSKVYSHQQHLQISKLPVEHHQRQHSPGPYPSAYKRPIGPPMEESQKYYYEPKRIEPQAIETQPPQVDPKYNATIATERLHHQPYSPSQTSEDKINYMPSGSNVNHESYTTNAKHSNQIHHEQKQATFDDRDLASQWYPPNQQTTDSNKRLSHDTPSPQSHVYHAHNYQHDVTQRVEAIADGRSSAVASLTRGADQNVISKLRSSLELKEMEKQKSQMRKQNSSEISEDDSHKGDMASILAARIRTKGELKGFTPIINYEEQPTKVVGKPAEISSEVLAPPMDLDGQSAFDLMDWGTACNEFVEQLQTGKKRGRRKRGPHQRTDAEKGIEETTDKVKILSMPGNDSQYTEVPKDVVTSLNRKEKSSSDEDKPLLFLRQQSVIQSPADLKEDPQRNRSESNKDDSTKESSATILSVTRSAVVERLSEKIARNMREKQRLEKEQRIAARLGKSSSSDSEPEPRVQRTKKRARKLRPRTSLGMKNSSDDNTDENENENDDKDSKHKLSDQSSSGSEDTDVETNKVQNKKLKAESSTETVKKPKKTGGDQEIPSSTKETTKRCKPIAVSSRKVSTRNSSKTKATSSEEEKSDDSTDEENRKKKAKSSENKAVTKTSLKTNIKEAPKNVGRGRSKSQLDVHAKPTVDIETMTRSKTKLVLEKKMSNGKVLRNDKVVHNIIVDKKAKTHESSSKTPTKPTANASNSNSGSKKESETPSSGGSCSKRKASDSESQNEVVQPKSKKNLRRISKVESSNESDENSEDGHTTPVIERLRTRKSKTETPTSDTKKKTAEKSSEKKNSGRTNPKKGSTTKTAPTSETKVTKFVPGWEAQVIEFKRKLKIPDSLITVARPTTYHRGSTSLPDLDPQSSDTSETFSIFKSRIGEGSEDSNGLNTPTHPFKRNLLNKFNNKNYDSNGKDNETSNAAKSIIDVLHQRVINPVKKNRKIRQIQMFSEPKTIPKGIENELLPTPGAENDEIFNMKATHFKTSVMASRTRTEQKVQKSKELIREVFGGEDRPASAPPLVLVSSCSVETITPSKNNSTDSTSTCSNTAPLTFSQQYEEMLRKMNIDFGEKIRKNKSKFDAMSEVSVKTEKFDGMEDEETQDTMLNDDGDTPSIASERDLATPVSFKSVISTTKARKSRGNRAGKRKGSSGFDYIRKKKKPPVPQINQDGTPTVTIPKRRAAAVNYLQEKDENDISREIKGWVPNKSIGESVMHKASRLGYVDVIAFCLDRLDMHPDQKDNAGYTPLHEACSRGHLEISRLLLQFGANHSETAQSGIRPLHEAIENGHIEVVRLLLSYGADPLLSTYSGCMPIALAETPQMTSFLQNYLDDIQSMRESRHDCWNLGDLWRIFDPDNEGYDALEGVADCFGEELAPLTPEKELKTPNKKNCDSNSNIMSFESQNTSPPSIKISAAMQIQPITVVKQAEVKIEQNIMYDKNIKYKNCTVVLKNIDSHPQLNHNPVIVRALESKFSQSPAEEPMIDSNTENFEIEESESPLPPIYLLKDEGQEKWVLLSDLCTLLKVKSKDAVLKQICPSSPPSSVNKELLRELKMSDFLEKAICLQLLCAGEKLNIRSSKVILVRYNESVQNLLGVQTIVMNIKKNI